MRSSVTRPLCHSGTCCFTVNLICFWHFSAWSLCDQPSPSAHKLLPVCDGGDVTDLRSHQRPPTYCQSGQSRPGKENRGHIQGSHPTGKTGKMLKSNLRTGNLKCWKTEGTGNLKTSREKFNINKMNDWWKKGQLFTTNVVIPTIFMPSNIEKKSLNFILYVLWDLSYSPVWVSNSDTTLTRHL